MPVSVSRYKIKSVTTIFNQIGHFTYTKNLPLLSYCPNRSIAYMGRHRVSVEVWPLTGPLSTPQMIYGWISVSGKTMLTGKTKDSEKKPSDCHSVHHKSYMAALGANPGFHSVNQVVYRLSYSTTSSTITSRYEAAQKNHFLKNNCKNKR